MQGNDDEQVTLLLKTSEIINRHTSVEDLHLTGKLTCLDTQLLGTAADGHEHWLSGSEEVVGRGHDCSIVIDSPELSRRHARFPAYSDKWVVEDCGSRNGVWLNNERVEPRKTVSNGDTIRFGRIPFRFEVVSMTATEAADKAAASSLSDFG